MLFGTEHRKSDRFDHKATVMIENEHSGHLIYGQMLNYSSGGMCIGSDAFYNKGTAIKIRFNNTLYKAAPKTYSGIVSWCKELVRDDFDYPYGVGIKCD